MANLTNIEVYVISMLLYFYFLLLKRTNAEIGKVTIDGQSRPTWFSQPFDHECLLDCTHELVNRIVIGDVSIVNKNCSVACERRTTLQRRMRSEKFKRVKVVHPVTMLESECLVGILREDLFCAVPARSSGLRIDIENGHQCKRRNYRYYLPQPHCDNEIHDEVGEESCQESCASDLASYAERGHSSRGDSSEIHRISVDVTRARATFRVCFDGRVSESYHDGNRQNSGRIVKHFCRAEMTPCSSCFRWGNWTALTSCSSTCGLSGTQTFYRPCQIRENTGIFGQPLTWVKIANAYCMVHFGGIDTKIGSCRKHIPCPQWSQWNSWSYCRSDSKFALSSIETTSEVFRKNGRKFKQVRRRREMEISSSPSLNLTIAAGFNSAIQNQTIDRNETLQKIPSSSIAISSKLLPNNSEVASFKKQEPPLTMTGSVDQGKQFRKRFCLNGTTDKLTECIGSDVEAKSCEIPLIPVIDSSTFTTKSSKDSDDFEENGADGDSDGHSEVQSTTIIRATQMPSSENSTVSDREDTTRGIGTQFPGATVHENRASKDSTTWTVMRNTIPTSGNRKTSSDRENEFTSILLEHAPLLIAGLLIFIVLLLVALIAVCGRRIYMQKNKNAKYDVTSPSFSAGTMGSIPSGIAQGFPHTLGLRRGSGTFGRSGSTINGVGLVSDALSSRGSCKSMASASSGNVFKMKTIRSKSKTQATSSHSVKGYLSTKSGHQNSPPALTPSSNGASRTETLKTTRGLSKTNLGDRKPSSSSLLSTSSTIGATASVAIPNSCSFQPLPPIPLNQTPHILGAGEKSAFKRATGRSSSLTPVEHDHRGQARSESVSGRVGRRTYTLALGGMHYKRGRDGLERSTNSSWTSRQKVSSRSTGRVYRPRERSETVAAENYCHHSCDESACAENTSRFQYGQPSNRKKFDISSSENEYWSVTRAELADSGTESSDTSRSTIQMFPRVKGRILHQPVASSQEVVRDRAMAVESRSRRNQDSENFVVEELVEGDDTVKMVDNVLYAVTTQAAVHQSIRASDEDEEMSVMSHGQHYEVSTSADESVKSFHESSGEGNAEITHGKNVISRFQAGEKCYNSIDFEDSSRGSDYDAANNEDDYDHLCDQFSMSNTSRQKARFPGTMTSLHLLRQSSHELEDASTSGDNVHDYECIEIDETSSSEDFCEPRPYTKVHKGRPQTKGPKKRGGLGLKVGDLNSHDDVHARAASVTESLEWSDDNLDAKAQELSGIPPPGQAFFRNM